MKDHIEERGRVPFWIGITAKVQNAFRQTTEFEIKRSLVQ